MTPCQIAWIKLIALVTGTGCAAITAAYAGGSKLWVAILIGIGVAGTNVYHTFIPSPNDSKNQSNQ